MEAVQFVPASICQTASGLPPLCSFLPFAYGVVMALAATFAE
jgi:hypothetical protein